MNRPLRRALRLVPLFALSAWSLSAANATEAYPRLVSPQEGATLTAGSLATVEWEGKAPLGKVEEWEAFLSLDGGRTHPLRVTPHLDIALQRFTFRVPGFPTKDARILLRFGDERQEVEIRTAQRFSIVEGPGAGLPASWSLSRGERALPDEGGVVFWVEGARDGSGVREVVTEGRELAFLALEPGRQPSIPLLPPLPQRVSLEAPEPLTGRQAAPLPARPRTEPSEAPQERPSVRLLISRFNE